MMRASRWFDLATGTALALAGGACSGGGGSSSGGDSTGVIGTPTPAPAPTPAPLPPPPPPPSTVGAVYVGTNNSPSASNPGDGKNYVVAFKRDRDGSLTALDRFSTRGVGRGPAAPPRLNPLVSQHSIISVDDRYLLVVNAGSNDITSFAINADFTLTWIGNAPTGGVSPVSIAYANGVVYVANADEDGVFNGPPDQSGSVSALRLDANSGQLTPIAGSTRSLGVRPSDLGVTQDGRFLIVSGLNAGSATLTSHSLAELSSYAIQADGSLAAAPAGTAISTLPSNAAGRNLPNAIGFALPAIGGHQFVLAAEARTATAAGLPGTFPQLQTGSVSSWELSAGGSFVPRTLDFLLGPSVTSGPLQAGWVTCSPSYGNIDGGNFFCTVATAAGATTNGIELAAGDGTIVPDQWSTISGVAANPNSATPLAGADGFVDLVSTRNFNVVYQLVGLKGRIDVYITSGAFGFFLTRRQQATSDLLPSDNLQGIAVVDARP